MARMGTFEIVLSDPDGVLDAIATLEHIRGDLDHRIAALRSVATVRTSVVSGSDEEALADAFTWFHIRLSGGCSESHKEHAIEYARTFETNG